MAGQPAARLLDPIAHTEAMGGFLLGGLIGAAVGVALVAATVATGGAALVVVAAAGGAVAAAGGGALAGEAIGSTFTTVTGSIAQVGSPNVLINGRPAIRASLDAGICANHAGPPLLVAQGSGSVLINGMPAARKSSLLVCSAEISGGSPNVFIGGDTATTEPISPEVPEIFNTVAKYMVGIGTAVALGAGALAAVVAEGVCGLIGFAGTVAGSYVGGELGGVVGGAIGEAVGGDRGRIIGSTLGSTLGGFAGGALGDRLSAGHPVDVASGELFTEELDFEIAGTLPLQWRRVWISSSTAGAANGGALGEGWHHNFDMALAPLASPRRIIARLADGRLAEFIPPTPRLPTLNTAERFVLHTDGTGFWLIDYAGLRYDFAAPALPGAPMALARISDPNGNSISLERTGRDLSGIVDSAGRRFRVECDALGRILAVDAPHPDQPGEILRLVSYGYDEAGNLVSAARADGSAFHYAYENHLIVDETRPAGLRFRFVWDDTARRHDARCVDSWGERPSGEGPHIYRAQLAYDVANRITVVTNGEGAVTRHRWNERHLVEETTDALGGVTIRRYDAASRLVLLQTPDGPVRVNQYDALGRLVARQAPERSFTVAYASDGPGSMPLDRMALVAGADGAADTFEYDARGTLTRQTDAIGRETSYLRDPRGLMLAARDGEGVAWRRLWSAQGDLIAEGPESQEFYRYAHDGLGRVVTVQRGHDQPVRLERDAMGRLTRLHRTDGTTAIAYNEEGKVTSHRDALGRETRWAYDGLPFPLRRIGPDGREVRYAFDSELNVTTILNAKNEQYTLAYDAVGRLIGERGFDGRTLLYRLNEAGHLVELQDAGDTTRFARDPAGRLLRTIFADGSSRRYDWDAAGRLTAAGNEACAAGFTYDRSGRLTEERQNGLATQHRYDARGRRAETILPDGRTVTIGYGTDGLYNAVDFDGAPVARVQRDSAGREILRQAGMVEQRQVFDPQGRLLQQSGATSAAGATLFRRGYGYDAAGQIVAIQDNLLGERRFRYDANARLLAVDGAAPEAFVTDPAGNILSSGVGLAPGEARGDRLLFHGDSKFEYDARGNRVRETRGAGGQVEVLYRYAADNLLTEVEERSRLGRRITRFRYDALRRRIGKTHEQFAPDAANGAAPAAATSRNETHYLWTGDVLLAESMQDDELAVVYLHEPGSFRPLAQVRRGTGVLHYHLDHLGTPQEVTNDNGEVVWAARLKAWGAVDRVAAAEITQSIRFQGQYHDEETGLHYNRHRYYAPAEGCFIGQDPIRLEGGMNLAAYAPNPTGWIDPLGLAGDPATATHITYLGTDAATGKPYVGYASMQGNQSGQDVLAYRYGGNYDRFTDEPSVLYSGYGQTGKDTARGLEQRNFEQAGGLEGTANLQNPVGVNNARRDQYLTAADEHLAGTGCAL